MGETKSARLLRGPCWKVNAMVLFVANLDKYTDEEDLRVLFSRYGTVADVDMFRDRDTGEPLGYGFVEMPDDWESDIAIKNLNGRFWNGRRLKVSERRPLNRDDDYGTDVICANSGTV